MLFRLNYYYSPQTSNGRDSMDISCTHTDLMCIKCVFVFVCWSSNSEMLSSFKFQVETNPKTNVNLASNCVFACQHCIQLYHIEYVLLVQSEHTCGSYVLYTYNELCYVLYRLIMSSISTSLYGNSSCLLLLM